MCVGLVFSCSISILLGQKCLLSGLCPRSACVRVCVCAAKWIKIFLHNSLNANYAPEGGGGEGRNGALALPLVLLALLCVICLPGTREAYKFSTHSHTHTHTKGFTHTHICTCARRWLALWRLFKETMNPAAKRDANKNQKQKRHKKCPTTSEKGNKAHLPLRHFDRSCAACTESKCLVRLLPLSPPPLFLDTLCQSVWEFIKTNAQLV